MREFVQFAAAELGISIRFEGSGEEEIGIIESLEGVDLKCKPGDIVVRVDPRYYRPTEVETLLGDPTKAKAKLGWAPKTTVKELVAEMVQADYASAKCDALVKSAGYKAFDRHE